jgi:multiple RNA-binding domain-containing protein 1
MKTKLTAAQIADEQLPKSRRQIREEKAAPKSDEYFPPPREEHPLKRKREEAEQDPKLKEFLEIYQPPSKTNIWTDGDAQVAAGNATAVEEPAQDVVVPAEESDDEYQVISKKPKVAEAPKDGAEEAAPAPAVQPNIPAEAAPVEEVDAPMPDAPDVAAAPQPTTDDDWLRSRTNRLLDLVEDDDVPVAPASAPTKPAAEKRDSPVAVEPQPQPAQPADAPAADAPDADSIAIEEEKIRETGRLYLRNLHFEVAEEDIRSQFSKYGSLDEVSCTFSFLPTRFRMNVKIGTTDASAPEVTL